MHTLTDILGERELPNPYSDNALLWDYAADGHEAGEISYLSLGETWSEIAPGLRECLSPDLPEHSHGYILSPYGLPALHRVLRSYITSDHDLTDVARLGSDYEVAVSQNSTRNAMFHFGRLLVADHARPVPHRAVAIAPTPGWDYAGVYGALGYDMRYFTLSPRTHYQPDPAEVGMLLRRARAETAGPVLLVINAQHNPTGANWDPLAVRTMIRAAHDTGACLLIDDAYYAVHNPDIAPTNTLRILLEERRRLPLTTPWLAVRSLGKQFHCNGWGIGALVSAPATMTRLMCELLPQYSFASAIPLQAAMARWLSDRSSAGYLSRMRSEYAMKRATIARRLTDEFGYPDSALFAGECAAYFLLRIPPWYSAGPESETTDYRRYCLNRSGVLLGESHMTTPGHAANDAQGYVRLFLGPPQATLDKAMDQMSAAGLTWRGRLGAETALGGPADDE